MAGRHAGDPERRGWLAGLPLAIKDVTDVAGVLDKSGDLVPALTVEDARRLIRDGTISGGMIPKIEGCIDVVEGGVEAVVIINGKVAHCVLLELLTEHGAGTMVRTSDAD